MRGLWLLAWRHAIHHRVRTTILVSCFALSAFIPTATHWILEGYQEDLLARAKATPLLAGAKGNRFDLTLGSLYFRASTLDPIPYAQLREIRESGMGIAVPLHFGFTARGFPLVGTSVEYFEHRGSRLHDGHMATRIGDVVLGFRVAQSLGAHVGDKIFSDPKELYDITKPPTLELCITGILSTSSSPDDHAVFCDIKTSWTLEGAFHGHQSTEKLDPSLVLGRTDQFVAVSGSLIEYNRVTDENVGSFHVHGDVDSLRLDSIMVIPKDPKSETILSARLNHSKLWQMVNPEEAIRELLSFVFRVKSLVLALSAVLFGSTILLTALVIGLSLEVRAGERRTIDRIGGSRFSVFKLFALEVVSILILAALVATIGLLSCLTLLPDLTTIIA